MGLLCIIIFGFIEWLWYPKKKSKSKSNKREEKNQNELIIKDIYWSMLIDSSSDGTANGSGGGWLQRHRCWYVLLFFSLFSLFLLLFHFFMFIFSSFQLIVKTKTTRWFCYFYNRQCRPQLQNEPGAFFHHNYQCFFVCGLRVDSPQTQVLRSFTFLSLPFWHNIDWYITQFRCDSCRRAWGPSN